MNYQERRREESKAKRPAPGPRRCHHDPAKMRDPLWPSKAKLPVLQRAQAGCERLYSDRNHPVRGEHKLLRRKKGPPRSRKQSARAEAQLLLLSFLVSRCNVHTFEVGIWDRETRQMRPLLLRELDRATGFYPSRLDRAISDLTVGEEDDRIVYRRQPRELKPGGKWDGKPAITKLTWAAFEMIGVSRGEIMAARKVDEQRREEARRKDNRRRGAQVSAPVGQLLHMVQPAIPTAGPPPSWRDYQPVHPDDHLAFITICMDLRAKFPDWDSDRVREEAAKRVRPPP